VFLSFCLCFFTAEGDLLKTGHKFLNFYVVILSGMTALLPPITLAVLG